MDKKRMILLIQITYFLLDLNRKMKFISDTTAITILFHLQAEKRLGLVGIKLQKLTFCRNAIYFFILIFFFNNCSTLFNKTDNKNRLDFDYKTVSKTYFRPENTKPFPLTVRRGNNLNGSISADGKYLFFSGDGMSNLNIYVRDLKSSVVVPLTLHPSADYKPSISPDGKKLAFVSERYDSLGDVFVADIQTEEILDNFKKGKKTNDSYPLFPLTNRDYLSKGIIQRCVDTDPTWSPDGRYLAYVSDCSTPGKTNIYLADSKNGYNTLLLTKDGAASPTYSPDNKFIYFISYKDSPLGEIYKIELSNKVETRVTQNSFMELSPSLSGDGKFLYFTSIRKDTNQNGKLGARDNGFIIRKNLATGEEAELTGGNFPLFDTKFTNFLDGSILFSASFDNSINLFFIPGTGEIPKRNTIQQQYELAERYRDRSVDFTQFAYNTIGTYYSEDPMYPLYKSRSDRQIVLDLEAEGRNREANEILRNMLSKKEDGLYGFSYALALDHTYKQKKANPIPALESFLEEVKRDPKYHLEMAPSVLRLIAEDYEEKGDLSKAKELFEMILRDFPKFYRTDEVKISLGSLEIRETGGIPNYFVEVYGTNLNRKNSLMIVKEISRSIEKIPDYPTQMKKIMELISNPELISRNPELHAYLIFLYAKNIRKEDKFQESNQELDKIMPILNINSYVYLSSLSLQYENFRDQGDYTTAHKSLLKLIENYEFRSGIEIDTEIIENTLQSSESIARNSELRENYQLSLENYEKINLFLSASIEKKLPIQGVFDQYATYYHRKMIETSLNLSQGRRDSALESLLSDANFLTGRKINLLGTTTKTLSSLFNFKAIKYFIDFKDFNYVSTYNQDAFDVPERFYNSRKESALKSLDLGAIYGYSYLLISKAVLRESIYLKNDSMTHSRKKKILEELKEAELNLQWIIYANPTYNEAYLLLGWMYQYIDIRKRSFLEGEEKREEEIFESLYLQYFPLKYLEENVELYKQIIEFSGKSKQYKLLSDLHLNLGNTYFLLNDFENAIREYSYVETNSKFIIPTVQFENYKHKTIYLFNFARAYIYAGQIEKAIPYLEEAISIYYKEEYFPLVAKIGVNKENEILNKELNEVRKKLTLLNSLLGLAEMELENYKKAIFQFQTALSMNGDTKYINDIGLYNSLALCYQKIGEYAKSEDALSKSDSEFKKKQSKLRKILNYSIWDTLFPENLRVIGEGRFPGEMPDEFSNLLGQGIRIQNSIDNKEFTLTSELIQKRYNFLKDHSLDKNTSGKKILEKSNLSLAYNDFQKGNYMQASDLYTKDYIEKSQVSMTDAFNSYLRSDIALFSHIEENKEPKQKLLSELNTNLKFLNRFKTERLKDCSTKHPNIEKETQFCEIDFIKNFPDHEISLVNNYFYLGEIYLSLNQSEEAVYYYGQALEKASKPGNIPPTEIGLSSDPYTFKQRCRLKITAAISHLRLRETDKFKELLREASYIADEFLLLKESTTIQFLLAEYNYSSAKSKKEYLASLELIKKIESTLKVNHGLFYSLDENFLNQLYTLRSYNYIQLKNIEELRISNEKRMSAILYKELLTNEFKFQEETLFQKLNELQLTVKEDHELDDRLENILLAKKESKNIVQLKSTNGELVKKDFQNINSILPKSIDIQSWSSPVSKKPIKLESDTCLLEIYSNKEEVILHFTRYPAHSKIISSDISSYANEIENYLIEESDIKKIVYLPSLETFQTDFPGQKFKESTISNHFEVRHIFKISQFTRETGFDFSRLKRVSSITNPKQKIPRIKDSNSIAKKINLRFFTSQELKNYLSDTDILMGSLDFYNPKLYLGEKREGYIPIKEVIENQWNIPLLIINNFQKNDINYFKAGFLYDILDFSGVQSILLLEESPKSEIIKEKILSDLANSNTTIQNDNLILIGEKITPYPEDQKLYEEEFKKFTLMGRREERKRNYLESIKFFLQANSVLPENRTDLQIESEINLNRLKKRLYEDFLFVGIYTSLLEIFSKNPVDKENFLFQTLISCYEDLGNKKCDTFYKEYKELKDTSENNRFIIEYYKSIRDGNIKFILDNKLKFKEQMVFQDPYLQHLHLANLYSNMTLWSLSLEEINLSLDHADSKQEKEYANSIKSDIYFEYFFINGIEINLDNQEKISFYAKNRIWDKYNEKLNSLFLKEPDSFKREYLKRIYKAYELMETTPDFQPISLSPIFLKSGEPSLSLLRETDRVFLFYLLVNSLPYQKGEELNNQFDLLLETEKSLKHTNKSLWMEVHWALSLYSRGDLVSSKKYFLKLKDEFTDTFKDPSFENLFLLLKYKLSKTGEDIEFSPEEKMSLKNTFGEWFSFYEEVESISSENQFYSLLSKLIASKKNQKLDLYNKRELLDFITFLMIEAETKKYWNVILDLTYYREQIQSVNDKIYEFPKFSNIPNLNPNISKSILQKIPENQSFIALSDIGIKTYKIHVEKNKISGEEIFSDNRLQKDLILIYLNSIKDFGESVLEQKYIEEVYRTKLNLIPNQISYLYFPSYHFKVYLHPNEYDKFFYILSLEEISKRDLSSTNKNFNPPYSFDITGKPISGKEKILFDLTEMERKLIPSSQKGKEVILSHETLLLKKNKNLEFKEKSLLSLKGSKPRKAAWMYLGSRLGNSSLKTDDFSHSLPFLDQTKEGVGVVFVGSQEDTHTAFFVKEFLKVGGPDSFFERYTDAMNALKKRFNEDRYWIGMRPYTNVLLKSK
jgi:tetratricopeptide (TPR) repeat protein